MIKKQANLIIIFAAIAIIFAGSLGFYFNHRINEVKTDYETKIAQLGSQTSQNMEMLRAALSDLGVNLSSQIGIIDTGLQNFRKQNEKDIKTMAELIDENERQSSISLNELRQDVKNIKIKSADFAARVD